MKSRLVTSFAFALIILGCRDTNAPVLRAVYVLQSIESQPLPAPYAPNRELPNRMFADTLLLGEGGQGEWRIVIEESVGGAKQHIVDDFTYTVTGDSHIEISFICPPGAACIAPPHLAGTVTETGIVFTQSHVTRAPLVFEGI